MTDDHDEIWSGLRRRFDVLDAVASEVLPRTGPEGLATNSKVRAGPSTAGYGAATVGVVVVAAIAMALGSGLLRGGPSIAGVDASQATATSETPADVGNSASPTVNDSPATATELLSLPPSASPENVVTTPRPTATPNLSPRIVSFDVPAEIDCTDQQFVGTIHVAWSIAHAGGVSLSIGPATYGSYQGATGATEVPFDCTQDNTYVLATTGGTGPAGTATRHAAAFAPTIELFTVSGAICDPTIMNGSVQVSFRVAYATGVTLSHGDTEEDPTTFSETFWVKEYLEFEASYPCPKPEQWYRLTTSGGYGAPASAVRQTLNNNPY
jgi:hypothetical protein